MTTVLGFPRSGTHWLRVMLEYALGEPVVHAHAYPEVVESPHVLIIRDPRDAFASRCRLREAVGVCREMEMEELALFLHGPNPGEPYWRVGWTPYTGKILDLADCFPHLAPLVRYEALYAAPEAVLARVLATLGRDDVSLVQIADAVERTRRVRWDPTDFPADEDMGRPGKWRAELQEATVRALVEDCGELMQCLGYGGGVA